MENFLVQTKRSLKIIITVWSLLIFTMPVSGWGENDCSGPTDLVIVKARQVTDSPAVYLISIINKSLFNIIAFDLGKGDKFELDVVSENIPDSIGVPQGWEGEFAFIEGTTYAHIFWQPISKISEIKPNAEQTGFFLMMPKNVKTWPRYDISGKEVRLFDVKSAPFQVLLNSSDVACVWGRVVSE